MSEKPAIAFVHSNIAQFRALHQHLLESGRADSHLVCSLNALQKNRGAMRNLHAFTPYMTEQERRSESFSLSRIELAQRRSIGIFETLQQLRRETPLDLVVAHVTFGSPSMFFDDIDIPVITYIEYPSFRQYGWDPKYPPADTTLLGDRSFEMLTCHAALKSQHVIVPSEHARRMFPESLQGKISARMEGFPAPAAFQAAPAFTPRPGRTSIGFAARDLSSAKGFEQFILVSKALLAQRRDIHFVVIGGTKTGYSFEGRFLRERFGDRYASFKDYIVEREAIDADHYTFTGILDYPQYCATLDAVDLFLYPVQFSSASWGLAELLNRGKAVIGSDRCYVPELVRDGYNGLLCPYEDRDRWVELASGLVDDTALRGRLAANAAQHANATLRIDQVATGYLEIFDQVIRRHRQMGNPGTP